MNYSSPEKHIPYAVIFGGFLISVILATTISVGAETKSATPDTKAAFKDLSKRIAEIIQQQKQTTFILGNFSGPPLNDGGGGAIGQQIAEQLVSDFKLKVDPNARLAISGSFVLDTGADGRLQLEIDVDVKDAVTGKRIASTGEIVPDTREKRGTKKPAPLPIPKSVVPARSLEDRDLLVIAATSVDLSSATTGKRREELIVASLTQKTTSHIPTGQSLVSASDDSPFGLEILVKQRDGSYVPRMPTIDQRGQAFVQLGAGDVYSIRLTNQAAFEVAANVTVDGISVFALSREKTGQLILDANDSADVRGWIVDNQKGREFQVQRDSPEVRKLLGAVDQSAVGTVTATFSRSWPSNKQPPEDEGALVSRGQKSTLRTKAGAKIDQQVQAVERQVGRVRSCITIRYTKPGT